MENKINKFDLEA